MPCRSSRRSSGSPAVRLLARPRLAWPASRFSSCTAVVDSADGQLARMTGQMSEFGRVLDGVSGYVTHVAVYLAIVALIVRAGRPVGCSASRGWFPASAPRCRRRCTTITAPLTRHSRSRVACRANSTSARSGGAWDDSSPCTRRASGLTRPSRRRRTAASPSRAVDGRFADDDRERYRACFYGPVRGWNLLGDNVRRYALAAFVLLHHLEWFILHAGADEPDPGGAVVVSAPRGPPLSRRRPDPASGPYMSEREDDDGEARHAMAAGIAAR